MQCAKLPRPTTKVRIQRIITEPVIECEPETSHAAVAMIHPAVTPLQKIVAGAMCAACKPSCTRACFVSGGSALVRAASAANANAPRTFAGSTVHHNRSVFQSSRFSERTRRNRIQRVLREELRAADDDHDEADGIEHARDKVRSGRGAEESEHKRRTQTGESHEDATGKARDGQRNGRALQLRLRTQRNLLIDVFGGGTLEVLLVRYALSRRAVAARLAGGLFRVCRVGRLVWHLPSPQD